MTGNQLKLIIEKKGVSYSSVAFGMGLASPMALQSTFKSPDIKSGHVEAAARFFGMTTSEFYEYAENIDSADFGPSPNHPEPDPYPEPQTQEAPATKDMQQVLLHLVAIASEQKEMIQDLSSQLAAIRAELRTLKYQQQSSTPGLHMVSDPTTL